MPDLSAPSSSPDRLPFETVRRWAMKAALVGFCTGVAAALAALQVP